MEKIKDEPPFQNVVDDIPSLKPAAPPLSRRTDARHTEGEEAGPTACSSSSVTTIPTAPPQTTTPPPPSTTTTRVVYPNKRILPAVSAPPPPSVTLSLGVPVEKEAAAPSIPHPSTTTTTTTTPAPASILCEPKREPLAKITTGAFASTVKSSEAPVPPPAVPTAVLVVGAGGKEGRKGEEPPKGGTASVGKALADDSPSPTPVAAAPSSSSASASSYFSLFQRRRVEVRYEGMMYHIPLDFVYYDHPGGVESILQYEGKDISSIFSDHPAQARERLELWKVGPARRWQPADDRSTPAATTGGGGAGGVDGEEEEEEEPLCPPLLHTTVLPTPMPAHLTAHQEDLRQEKKKEEEEGEGAAGRSPSSSLSSPPRSLDGRGGERGFGASSSFSSTVSGGGDSERGLGRQRWHSTALPLCEEEDGNVTKERKKHEKRALPLWRNPFAFVLAWLSPSPVSVRSTDGRPTSPAVYRPSVSGESGRTRGKHDGSGRHPLSSEGGGRSAGGRPHENESDGGGGGGMWWWWRGGGRNRPPQPSLLEDHRQEEETLRRMSPAVDGDRSRRSASGRRRRRKETTPAAAEDARHHHARFPSSSFVSCSSVSAGVSSLSHESMATVEFSAPLARGEEVLLLPYLLLTCGKLLRSVVKTNGG